MYNNTPDVSSTVTEFCSSLYSKKMPVLQMRRRHIPCVARNTGSAWLVLVLIAVVLMCLYHTSDPESNGHTNDVPNDHSNLEADSHRYRKKREVETVMPSAPVITGSHSRYPEKKQCDTRYTLALSYFDQITSALKRFASLQCWAFQFDMAVVEPFLPYNSTFMGVPLAHNNPKSGLGLSGLFNLDSWNIYNFHPHRRLKSSVLPSSIVSWLDFVGCAPRNVIAVQFIFKKVDSNTMPCTFAKLQKHWPSLFLPHGFKVVRKVCIDLKEYSGLLSEHQLEKLVFGAVLDPVTVIFEEWRGMQSDVTRQASVNIESACTNMATGRRLFDVITPSDSIIQDTQVFISRYFMGKPFITVMLRLERFHIYDADQGHSALKELETSLRCIRSLFASKQVFVTTDVSIHGSQTVPIHAKNVKFVQSVNKVLSVFHGPNGFIKQESRLKKVCSIHNPAYLSTLHKAVASRGKCLILIGGGNFQKQASAWHRRLYLNKSQIITWKGQGTCKHLVKLCSV